MICILFLYYVTYFCLYLCVYYSIDEVFFCLICSKYYFYKYYFIFILGFFFVYYFLILFYFQRNYWIFVERYKLEFNSFIALIQIYCRINIIFSSKRIWLISRPFIFGCHFDLPIWSSLISWYLFTFHHKMCFICLYIHTFSETF